MLGLRDSAGGVHGSIATSAASPLLSLLLKRPDPGGHALTAAETAAVERALRDLVEHEQAAQKRHAHRLAHPADPWSRVVGVFGHHAGLLERAGLPVENIALPHPSPRSVGSLCPLCWAGLRVVQLGTETIGFHCAAGCHERAVYDEIRRRAT